MGKLPPIKRFRAEDYPGVNANFLLNLSNAIESIVNTLDNFVNFDNLSGQLYERVDLATGLTISTAQPLLLPWYRKFNPVAVWVGGAWIKGQDEKVAIGSSVSIEWDFNPNTRQIIIKALHGLTQPLTQSYQITLIAQCR